METITQSLEEAMQQVIALGSTALVIGIIISLLFVAIFLEKHNTVKPFVNLDRFYDFKKLRIIEKSEKLLDIIYKRR